MGEARCNGLGSCFVRLLEKVSSSLLHFIFVVLFISSFATLVMGRLSEQGAFYYYNNTDKSPESARFTQDEINKWNQQKEKENKNATTGR
jgi:hypothetical protein